MHYYEVPFYMSFGIYQNIFSLSVMHKMNLIAEINQIKKGGNKIKRE